MFLRNLVVFQVTTTALLLITAVVIIVTANQNAPNNYTVVEDIDSTIELQVKGRPYQWRGRSIGTRQQRQAASSPQRINSQQHQRPPRRSSYRSGPPEGNSNPRPPQRTNRRGYNIQVVPIPTVYLGEGPVWDGLKQELYYVDLLKKGILRYVPRTGQQYKLDILQTGEGWGDSVPFVIPVKGNKNKYIIGLGRSIRTILWNGQSGSLSRSQTLQVVNDGNPNGRFNDAKCDAMGRLWAGTMGFEHGPGGSIDLKKGSVYSLERNTRILRKITNVDISNGIAWSPDNRIFYFVDSFAYNVVAYDYDIRRGNIRNQRVVFDLKSNGITEGIADGMTIDIDGNLWIAIFGGFKIIKVDPRTGKILQIIRLPTKNITSAAFGGPNLDILYVTSAQHGLSKEQLRAQPKAGALFQITNLGTRGVSAGVPYVEPWFTVPWAGWRRRAT